MHTIHIDIYCIGGEVGYGLASTADPLGYFVVACTHGDPISHPNHTRVTVMSGVGCARPTVDACMDIINKKCEHVHVRVDMHANTHASADTNNIIHANFGWLLSCAHYIKAKYENTQDPRYEQEFLATQLSGYGPAFNQLHLSESRCAKLYPVTT